jgi:hypothetical protein
VPPRSRRRGADTRRAAGPARWPAGVVAVLCAAAAAGMGAVAAAVASAPAHHRASLLVHMSVSDPVSRLAGASDPRFAFVPPGSHYDGTYYYAIARDPLALGTAHTLIDQGAYRYGHAFYGQLAFLLSAGRPAAIPEVLLALSLAALAVAAWCASRLATGVGVSAWAGLVVALSPGLLYATTVDTAEPLVAALLALALLAWHRRRLLAAGVALAALALTKEPMALVPVGLGLYEAARLWRADRRVIPTALRRRPRRVAGVLAALGAGPAVLIGWLLYVDRRFGIWPLRESGPLLGVPLRGLNTSLRQSASFIDADFADSQLGAAEIPIVLALFGIVAVGLVLALRLRSPLDGAYLLTAPLVLLLGPLDLVYPKDLIRITVVPLLLLPAALRGCAPLVHPPAVTPAAVPGGDLRCDGGTAAPAPHTPPPRSAPSAPPEG